MITLLIILLILSCIGLLSPVVAVIWWVWVRLCDSLDRIHRMLTKKETPAITQESVKGY